jgi:glutamate/tyrosine decarboxylase-like PLP-dependent enzyme
MPSLLDDAAHRAKRYLATLDERKVAPALFAIEALSALDTPLPDGPTDPATVIRTLDEAVSPATMAMAGPRFFGFVIGGSLPAALAANWLAAAWDQNAGLYTATPGVSRLESVALRWLVELFGLPDATEGAFVTGGTMANFTALAAARHHVLQVAGWDAEADGLFGAPPVTVVVGEEAHPTLFKSLGLLGFGRNRVVRVPVDGQGRMLARHLPTLDGPAIVCTQVGNVNTGAFDPVAQICDRVRGGNAWVHVDGAFGLWARTSSALQSLSAGVEHADSWATDAHKWLNVPYDSGLAFVKRPGTLPAAMAITAAYLPGGNGHRSPSDFTPELSRRARGVEVWAALRSLGKSGVADLIDRTCGHARSFASRLTAAGHEVLNEVVLNQVLVAFGSPERTERVIARIQEDGTCWCGTTYWQGRRAMRISVCSWATTTADVERSMDAILRCADNER